MSDNIFCGGSLSMMVTVAIAIAGGASLILLGHSADAPPAADMPVVALPAVVVAGKRLAPAQELAAAATAATPVVQLPPVAVTGRRVPSEETVTLAQRAAND
jgi:hypothetical protein